MQVNCQRVFGEQKTNFECFNVLKTLIIPTTLYIYQAKKHGGTSI